MPITINGSGSLTGLSVGGLPDGSVNNADLASNAVSTSKILNGAVTIDKMGANEASGLCKAWVNFNGTGAVAIRAQYNVSSITDNGVGNYTVNFATALADANYSWVSGQRRNTTIDASILQIQAYSDSAQTASALQVIGYAVNPATSGLEDPLTVNIAVFR